MQDIQSLLEMLTYKRPHKSATEREFIEKFIEPLGEHPNTVEYYCDEVGNVFVSTSLDSKSLFTAHIDTVHSLDGKQVVTYDKNLELIYLDDKAALATNCLGADDTAGMWLMLQMIDHGVPGTYAFFRGEERGGIGSRHAAKHTPEFFKRFDKAVAFDRRSTGDVITHQAGGRCCSDAFAQDLAAHLNVSNVSYAPCANGIYTDTANLTDLIGECTNLSCGYDMEHSVNESLDVLHLTSLRDAVLIVDWDGLTIKREPGEIDPYDYGYNSWKGSDYSTWSDPTPEKITTMRYADLVAWVKQSSAEDVAEAIYDLVDQLIGLEEQLNYSDSGMPMAEGWQ